MSPFTPAELELLLCGVATLDVEEWRKATVQFLLSSLYSVYPSYQILAWHRHLILRLNFFSFHAMFFLSTSISVQGLRRGLLSCFAHHCGILGVHGGIT